LKTYLPDGDIDLTAVGSVSYGENLVHEIHAILLSEEQRKDCEFEVNDVQLINAEVFSLPYCYLVYLFCHLKLRAFQYINFEISHFVDVFIGFIAYLISMLFNFRHSTH
jgi:hypothetical protein